MKKNTLLQIRNGYKSFNRVYALKNVNFTLEENEILGLIGDNGAGKSTLIKILSGFLKLDKGEIIINEVPINGKKYNVNKARKLGLETVYQEKSLGENQTLWRNLFIGRHLKTRLGFIKTKDEKKETLKVLQNFIGLNGIGISPQSLACTLSGGERQGLAIGRAMYFNSPIVILDEPTTALSLKETQKVLQFIRNIKKEGKSCIFISHNMNHVYQVADRIVFLEKGTIVDELSKEDKTLENITSKLMHIS